MTWIIFQKRVSGRCEKRSFYFIHPFPYRAAHRVGIEVGWFPTSQGMMTGRMGSTGRILKSWKAGGETFARFLLAARGALLRVESFLPGEKLGQKKCRLRSVDNVTDRWTKGLHHRPTASGGRGLTGRRAFRCRGRHGCRCEKMGKADSRKRQR